MMFVLPSSLQEFLDETLPYADLCDAYPELVQVLEPMFSNFGGRDSFGGEIVTIKCFEDNSLVKEQVELKGKARCWWSTAAVRCAGAAGRHARRESREKRLGRAGDLRLHP